MNTMNKKEFWLGIAIITFCVGMWTILDPPIIETTLYVKIERIDKLNVTTSEDGVVTVKEGR